jgi:2-polyprenyl-3-methyl-5-hydroxy-6-metoxy-1,4-benzoquinol methylase
MVSVIERAVLKKIKNLQVPRGCPVLDVPCGSGELSMHLSALGFDVYAADLDSAVETTLKGHFRHVDLNDNTLPWPNDTFDLVCSIEGIEHLENPHRFLRDIHRVLRPSGRLILTTPNITSLRSRMRFFGSGFFHKDSRPLNETARHPLHHIGLRSFSMLRYDLHTTGFRIEDVASTHVKPVSWPYLVFAPWMWLYTMAAFRKEKDPIQRTRNEAIRRVMFSPALLFGENLLLVAKKQ